MPTSKLISGYRRFREKFESDHEVFEKLAEEGQNPKVMWIGCADSRVVPELITGADPGELRIAFTQKAPNGAATDDDNLRVLQETATLCAELGHAVQEANHRD